MNVPNLDHWPGDADPLRPPWCLLLLCGDHSLEAPQVESFAARALHRGMVYLSIWGRDSAWIEDVADWVDLSDALASPIESETLMTTAHSDLAEAIEFFENSVRPPTGTPSFSQWWVVSIDDEAALTVAARSLGARNEIERRPLAT